MKNSGDFDGEEIVQLYTRDIVASITRPLKELKGFQKIFLKQGETKQVSFEISEEDLKFYNANLSFEAEAGEFEVYVGSNSADVLTESFKLKK